MSTRVHPPPSCQDDVDVEALSCEQARERILARVRPVAGRERLPLRDALGRVLAEDVHSAVDVPAQTNSAMDGYALRAADCATPGEHRLRVTGTALAGHPVVTPLGPGECVRIMTGAPLPPGADSVVIQERVRRDGDAIRLEGPVTPHDNVRDAGEDIARGSAVLAAGQRLRPADLGLIASIGVGEVTVRRAVRVAYFSTGDELRSVGEPLAPGDVYDSNRYTLHGMLTRLGCQTLDMGVVRDEPERLRQALTEAAAAADVVITSGGVSVGEADYIKGLLAELGEVDFWKVSIKPGRPLAFGAIGEARFFGLPGNPVSVMVTFYQFVQPALRAIAGESEVDNPSVRARCTTRLRKRPGRTEFQRGVLSRAADGTLEVAKTGAQGSGILSSMSRGNCLIVLPLECGDVAPGSWVEVQPFDGLT